MFNLYLKWLAITFIFCLGYSFFYHVITGHPDTYLDAGLVGKTMRYLFFGMVLPYEIFARVIARIKA